MAKVDYEREFERILTPVEAAKDSITKEDLFAKPSLGTAKAATKLKHLKSFMARRPEFFGTVQGVLLPSESLIDLAERRIGEKVSESNVVRMNRECASIVGAAFQPVVEQVVRDGLAEHIQGDICTIRIETLMEFLLGDFAEFSKGAGNGLVSVAGSLNELLLLRCLVNVGLANEDFSRTGTESDGDIIVHSHAGNRRNLGVEIKSYHARERLLRGLRDLEGAKIGAGYFIDAAEFNEGRTKLLLATQAAAIYMPQTTVDELAPRARELTSQSKLSFGSRFYRPIEQFASDMLHFSQKGVLPNYP